MINRLLLIKWWDYPIGKIESIVPFLCNQNNEEISKNLTKIEEIIHNNF